VILSRQVSMEAVVEELRARRAMAILRHRDTEVAREAMSAAVRGGFRVVELTHGIPGVYELIRHFAAREGLLVGAGTVMTAAQARESVESGAKFLVSPTVDEEVIAEAKRMGVAIVPGAYTPAEMMHAHAAGAPLVKLFPAPADGPTWVRQILGPLPFLKIIPTAGVNASNARDYLDAGAWSVGFVSSLFTARDLDGRKFDAIEARARDLLESTESTRL
jgi:2-dehydro-3-deoxyphosphogluconate aldolase/(4S)-4-hydroxy-2-oxoglutarate aldolase